MRKSIKKILNEQLSDRDKVEELEQIRESLIDGYHQLEESWGFDDATDGLMEYFETGGVTLDLRDTQQSLKNIFNFIKASQDEAKNAIDSISLEIDRINPPSIEDNTLVGKNDMDSYLRGGGSVGGL